MNTGIQEIRRNMKNVVKNYSDAQVKVRAATSNDAWGPSSTQMGEIADLTYNVVAFSEMMQIIWKRLNDHGKNWRHVYKSLVLLEYLIKTGSEKVTQQCRDNLFTIQTLKDFQHFEENKDQGNCIREKSKMLVGLLKDEEKLKVERARALKAKSRFAQSVSYSGASGEGTSTEGPRASASFNEPLESAAVAPELEQARPQTVGEEELQLQLALAMSKEEADQEERLRKNDDLRLKLALQESEKNAKPKSAVDDLLELGAPSSSAPGPSGLGGMSDPWGAPMTLAPGPVASLLPSPPNKQRSNASTALNAADPWSTPSTSNPLSAFDTPNTSNAFGLSDPWGTSQEPAKTSPALNDPWAPVSSSNSPAMNDPWGVTSGGASDITVPSMYPSVSPVNSSIRKTPENFLGPNSNLVNLDALISKSASTQPPPVSNNPFAPIASVPTVSNPFQVNKPSQPSMNQLRAAQTNQFGVVGGSSNGGGYSNANALDSLFNSSSTSTTLTSSGMNNGSSMSTTNWPTAFPTAFPPAAATTQSPVSPNNPFAM